jgi:hypothetical protein
MGAESAPTNPLGRIDPAMFAPKPDVVVEPRAITAMQEAFRNGQISANEIYDRMTMKPVVEAQVQNATDPQLVEARKQMELAKAKEAQNQLAVQEIALAQAKLAAKMPEQVREMQAELVKQGWGVSPSDSETWTPEDSKEVVRRWSVAEDFKAKQARVAAELSLVKPENVVTERGTEMVPFNQGTATPVDPQRVAAAQQFITQFSRAKDYDKAGQPPAPALFDAITPGTVATPADLAATAGAPAPAAGGIRGTLVKPTEAGKMEPPSLGEQQAKLITQLPQAYSSLNQIAQTFNKYKNDSKWPEALAPLKGFIDEKNPWNVDAKTLTAAVDAAVPGFARGIFGEVGVLTDRDVTRYRALLPTARTPDDRAKILMQLLGEKLYDTTLAFVSVYEGNPAVESLKKSMEISDEEVAQYRSGLAEDVRSYKKFGGESAANLEQLGTRSGKAPVSSKEVTISGLGKVRVDMSSGTPRVMGQNPIPPVKYTPPATLGAKKDVSVQKKGSHELRSRRTTPKTIGVEPK